MSSLNDTVDTLTHPITIFSSVEPQKLSSKGPITAAGSENEKFAESPLEIPIGDSNHDIVLVDYEENDPENPLNWSPMRKWLIVCAISWMGFVRWASFVLPASVYLPFVD